MYNVNVKRLCNAVMLVFPLWFKAYEDNVLSLLSKSKIIMNKTRKVEIYISEKRRTHKEGFEKAK